LTWTAPPTSTSSSADDTRPITYRVYRELDGSGAWAELTNARITGAWFDDTDTTALDGPYRYAVQAWDPNPGTGYGQIVLPQGAVLPEGTTTSVFSPAPGAPLFTITGVPSIATSQPVTPAVDTTTSAPVITATLDGAPWTVGTKSAPGPAVTTPGVHTLIVRVTGPSGAREHSVVFTVDTTAPVTTDNHPAGTVLTAVTVFLTPADSLSGVDATYYKLDTGAWTKYSGGVQLTSWKTHTLSYYSIDNAGNKESVHTVTIVMRQPTTLSVTSSTKSPKSRHAFTLSGYLAPGGRRDKLILKYQKPGSSKWYSVTRYTVTAGSRGKWTYKYTPPKKGTYHFKISYAGSTSKYKSASTTLALKAK
jgi:hypothetical protein